MARFRFAMAVVNMSAALILSTALPAISQEKTEKPTEKKPGRVTVVGGAVIAVASSKKRLRPGLQQTHRHLVKTRESSPRRRNRST